MRSVHTDGVLGAIRVYAAAMGSPASLFGAWAASNANSLVLCARSDLSAFGAENLQGVSRRIALTEEGSTGATRQLLAVYRH